MDSTTQQAMSDLLIPSQCPYCHWTRLRPNFRPRPHRDHCPSYSERPVCHEITPGLWVGSVEVRAEPGWDLVVGILCESERERVRSGPLAPFPSCGFLAIDHADGETGLLAKCSPAWARMAQILSHGRVLVHCHQGASRSVAVAAGFLIGQGMAPADAVRLCYERRPAAMHLSPVFQRELIEMGGRS